MSNLQREEYRTAFKNDCLLFNQGKVCAINKRVLITGHTGFKGSWLLTWLLRKQAKLYGFSLNMKQEYSIYECLKGEHSFSEKIEDIRSHNILQNYIEEIQPQIIFHMAAQPLVRMSYDHPLDTWNINTLGTINLLNSLKVIKEKCAVIIISSSFKSVPSIYPRTFSPLIV